MKLVLVGLGKVGSSIYRLLYESHTILGVVEPREADVPDNLQQPRHFLELSDLPADLVDEADLFLIAVPESELPTVLNELSLLGKNISAVHTSGSMIGKIDAAHLDVACMHPVAPFPKPFMPREYCLSIPYVVTGKASAVSKATKLLAEAGCKSVLTVDKLDEDLYHAACVMIANFTTAMTIAGDYLLRKSGLSKDEAAIVSEGLLRAVVEVIEKLGPQRALTGPAVRKAKEVIQAQKDALQKIHPALAHCYQACTNLIWAFESLLK